MFAVFVQRGRADTVQFTARQRRLDQVGGIHRTVGFARANQRVHLVDEQHDFAAAAVTSFKTPSAALRIRRGILHRRSARPCPAPCSVLLRGSRARRH